MGRSRLGRGRRRDAGSLLVEVGLLGMAAALVGAVGALAVGAARGSLTRAGRHAEAPPSRGSVPAERHRHTRSAAAR
ncbi:MAG TPA: hypothetical protein VF763_02070 [Candidatus Limnocylindrales bacterium]